MVQRIKRIIEIERVRHRPAIRERRVSHRCFKSAGDDARLGTGRRTDGSLFGDDTPDAKRFGRPSEHHRDAVERDLTRDFNRLGWQRGRS